MESGDAKNLKEFVVKGSENGWRSFFVTVKDIKLDIHNQKIKFNKSFTTATLTFDQSMSFFNESKGQTENMSARPEWKLKQENSGTWKVSSVSIR